IGFGILLIAPLARALTSAWDWRVAMLVLGDLAWLVIVPVALLLREPASEDRPAPAPGATRREYTTREVLAAPQFWAIALTHFALVTREYFGEKVMGTAYGAVFLISTLGMGVGSFAGGAIYDRLGAYTWLFLGSAAIGVMAVVLAFTFRRPRVGALQLASSSS